MSSAASIEKPTEAHTSRDPRAWLLGAYGILASVWAFFIVRNLALDLRFEDAYIVLRYARNLLDGHGFVFNPGERVLGVTTPLHTLISTLYVGLGGEAAAAWQNVAGVLALIAQGALVLLLLCRLDQPWAALPAALLTLGNYHAVYLYFGMETHLFVALGLLALWLHLDPEPKPIWLGIVLGLTFLVRYDAALLAGLIGLERWYRERRLPVAMTVAFFVVVSPWLLFAQLYFGSILPAPAAAKGGFTGIGTYLRHVYAHYVVAYGKLFEWVIPFERPVVWLSKAFPLPVALGVIALFFRGQRTLVPALYPALHVLVYAAIGADPGFAWHYLLLGPFGFLFFCIGVVELSNLGRTAVYRSWPFARRSWLDRQLFARHTVIGVLILACLAPLAHLWQQMHFRYRPDTLTIQLHEMGSWLAEHYPAETSLLQPAIGTLGWQSGLRIVDHAGLVTPGLYFYDDSRCTPLEEVVRLHQPDLILHSQWSQAEPEALGYRAVHTFTEPFTYIVFEREDRSLGPGS